MELNTLKPNKHSHKPSRRLGRGHTRGKTCGRGHKGYKSRSGSSVPATFEGGQMPIQRRLPKVGFSCASAASHIEIRLSEINAVVTRDANKDITVDMNYLRENKLLKADTRTVKVFLSGEIKKAVKLDVPATAGVKKAIAAAGGECA